MTRDMTQGERESAAIIAERVSRALGETERAKAAQDAWIWAAVHELGVSIGAVARSQGIAAQTAYRAMARHEQRVEDAGQLRGQTSIDLDTAPAGTQAVKRRKGGDGKGRVI